MLPTPEPTQEDEKVYTFNVSPTIYTLLKKTATRGTRRVATMKEEKLVKVKELPFAINEGNYINFLTSLLEKHGQEQYKVLEKCCFPFKYVPPKLKGSVLFLYLFGGTLSLMCTSQRSGDGMDIDNESDYKEMVQKIRKHGVSTTKIFVDMKDVEKLPMLSTGGTVEDEEDETRSNVEASAVCTSPSHATWALILQIQSSKVSDMDRRLMRCRLILQE